MGVGADSGQIQVACANRRTLTSILSLRERKLVARVRRKVGAMPINLAVAKLALRRWRFAVIFSGHPVNWGRTPEMS